MKKTPYQQLVDLIKYEKATLKKSLLKKLQQYEAKKAVPEEREGLRTAIDLIKED